MSKGEKLWLTCWADFIPIPGTKHVKYLKDNAGAAEVEFSKDDEKRFRDIVENVGGAKGARYPEGFLASCFGETPELGQA